MMDQYLKENYKDKTDRHMAKVLGVAHSTVTNRRYKLGLQKKEASAKSLCWDCANAYPLKCEWVNKLEPVWIKAITKVVGVDEEVKVVVKCKGFLGEG